MLESIWNKGGLIYKPDSKLPWAASHAQIPIFSGITNNSVQILFSSRDKLNKSHIAKLNVSNSQLDKILHIEKQPILELGKIGTFDDSGMMPSAIVEHCGLKYLYYIGWNIRSTVPYHNAVGLAISSDNGKSFERLHEGPIMDRTSDEPYFIGTTCIRVENGIWRNWYMSCVGWQNINGIQEPRYHLKYAESLDGINWKRDGTIAIELNSPNEGGISKASIIKKDNTWRMWYSYRGLVDYRHDINSSYRIGYAESTNGFSWIRMDDRSGISISNVGWDSEMIAYPEVFELNGRLVMLYNGNGFGASGFGYATST